jgi:hypothetical protein
LGAAKKVEVRAATRNLLVLRWTGSPVSFQDLEATCLAFVANDSWIPLHALLTAACANGNSSFAVRVIMETFTAQKPVAKKLADGRSARRAGDINVQIVGARCIAGGQSVIGVGNRNQA